MNDGPGRAGLPAGDGTGVPALPEVVDRAAWQAQLDALLVREKAHTRERDAIAAARRRLAMVEADPSIPLTGERGPVTLLDVPWYSAQDCAGALLGGRWFGMQVCATCATAAGCSRPTGAAAAPPRR